jgi:CheY-like chemotaxis protein
VATPIILVVEDDADVRDALAEALGGAGLRVELAVDGQDALERLRAGCMPAAILLDLRMPRMSGELFLRSIRAEPRLEHLPVITMTAGADSVEDDDVVARLRKPFDLDQLLEIVVSLCPAVRA